MEFDPYADRMEIARTAISYNFSPKGTATIRHSYAEEITSTPRARTISTVPASTLEM